MKVNIRVNIDKDIRKEFIVIKDKRLWGEIDIMNVDLVIGIIIGFALWPFILMLTNWVEDMRDYYKQYQFEKEQERKRKYLYRLTYGYDDGYKWKNDKDLDKDMDRFIF